MTKKKSKKSKKTKKGTVGVIGAGVMGTALIKGLISSGKVAKSSIWASVRTDESAERAANELDISVSTDYSKKLKSTDILLLCIKPAGIESLLHLLRQKGLPEKTLIISVAAGVTIETMEVSLSNKNPVIRSMPNTPCVVGQGMTAICGGQYTTKDHIGIARDIFESVGECIELPENCFNAVTGLGGSGPAYMFMIMEALADGGVKVGLPRKAALQIVAQMVLGAATMVKKADKHPAALKDEVTTPAGCTIGAMLIMEDGKIRSVLARAVEEATRIAGQLG